MANSSLQGRALLLTVTVVTSLGFMLIGYDNGLMGGLVNSPAFNITFDSPDPTMIGVIVAIFEVGCFFGSILSAIFGERLGRRHTIGHGCWVMIIGAILQASSYSRAQLIVSRIVSGVGLGIINSTIPVLQAEFSPKATRGIYVCAQLSTLNFGIFVVYWIDYAISSRIDSAAWRIPVILQCVCILPMLVLLMLIPETPRWLAAHGRADDCARVLARMKSASVDDAQVQRLHEDLLRVVRLEESVGTGSWRELLANDCIKSRNRLLIACAIQAFQQLGGINAVIYYTHTLFSKSIGFNDQLSALMSGSLQAWFFVASFIPWLLIDRLGRKPLFVSMISLMAVAMAVQAGLIYQVQHKTTIAHGAGIGAVVMLFVFQGAFTVGFQATVWVYPSEILPLKLRQRGSSISTAVNWIFNYVSIAIQGFYTQVTNWSWINVKQMIVQITPIAIENIGWKTYIIFAILNATWVPIIILFFPETKGLELEEIDMLFAGDNVVTPAEAPADETRADNGTKKSSDRILCQDMGVQQSAGETL